MTSSSFLLLNPRFKHFPSIYIRGLAAYTRSRSFFLCLYFIKTSHPIDIENKQADTRGKSQALSYSIFLPSGLNTSLDLSPDNIDTLNTYNGQDNSQSWCASDGIPILTNDDRDPVNYLAA